jgi:putative phosphoesterase
VRAAAKKPSNVQQSRSIALDARGRLRLACIADTHSNPHPKAVHWIERLSVDAILHAGDIGDLSVLDTFRPLAPLIAVRGNIDERASDLPDVVTLSLTADGANVMTLLLMHIAVYGPKLRADAARLAAASEARLLVCGHSHVPFIGRDRGVTLFNPGSIGPRRMHLPIVFGVLEVAEGKLTLRHISCETGEEWLP